MLRFHPSSLKYRYFLIPLLILMVTVLARNFYLDQFERKVKQEFETAANRTRAALEQRLQLYSEALTGLKGLYVASKQVTRVEFYNYVNALQLQERYPGFQALSFNRLVLEKDKEAFEASVRLDKSMNAIGFPDFSIKPAGQRKDYIVVESIEPLAGNEQALGFDVASNPVRRHALAYTRDTGLPMATAPITLVQETGNQSGFLMFMPIFRIGAPQATVLQRQLAFRGVVVAVFRVEKLLKQVLSEADLQQFSLKISDAGLTVPDSNVPSEPRSQQIFHSNSMLSAGQANPSVHSSPLIYRQPMSVAGRHWLLVFQAQNPLTQASTHLLLNVILGGGIIISLLFFGVSWSFGARRQATAGSARLAQDLSRSQEEVKLAATVFKNSSEGLMITDTKGEILVVNQAFTKITGYAQEEVLHKTPKILKSERHGDAFYENMWNSLVKDGNWQGEIWNRRKDGSLVVEWLTINAYGNNPQTITHYVGIFRDITQEKQAQDHIQHLAYHDPLTDLPNRSLLKDRIGHTILEARREGFSLALMFIDLDRFKIINDSLGHLIGDKLLQSVALRIKSSLRDSDTVARFGGDEFVVLLSGIRNLDRTNQVSTRIMELMSETFHIDGHVFHTSASIGISLFPQDGDDTETLMKHADIAMYHAKEEGRNNTQFFNAQMNQKALDRLEIESGLHRALEKQELELFYQPQVNLSTHQIVGLEALIRWRHPQKGLVAPLNFISIAEESDLIHAIGDWVLLEACRQGKALQELGFSQLTMAVNLSARQFEKSSRLLESVATALNKSGLEAKYLELEVTETVLMRDKENGTATLVELQAMGVGLSLDDFGTGYSSLSYLRRFPIDTLKVDQSFISSIGTNKESEAIVIAIISLAHNLGLKVVAEGVETHEQLQFLQEQLCEIYQGYLCSKPVPAELLTELLAPTLLNTKRKI
ncbi:MAG: EAL domain-containing protein [Bermanella sp.]